MPIIIKELDAKNDYSLDIARLYKFENWLMETEDVSKINIAVKNSYCAFGAFDGAKMVGFFRALSDGVSDAYLLDLIVDPNYRKQGIGSKLTSAITTKLKSDKLSWITCIATPGNEKLYAQFGKKMDGHTPMRF